MKFILAKKVGMTTIFKEDGTAKNVSVLEVGKNIVSQVRNQEKDGYCAVQVSLEKKGSKKNAKSRKKYEEVTEFKLSPEDIANYKKGDEIKIDQFQEGEKVAITGISKGKGFQGVVKRHNFKGSPASHGHRHDLRAPGSIGSAFPEHVLKGKRMAGRMGDEKVTVKNLELVKIFSDKSLLAFKGAVPGCNGSVVKVVLEK